MQQPHSKQAIILYFWDSIISLCRDDMASLVGTRFMGHTSTQRPHRTQAVSSSFFYILMDEDGYTTITLGYRCIKV